MKLSKILLLSLLILNFFSQTYASSCSDVWEQIDRNYDNLGEYSNLYGMCGNEFKDALREQISTNRDLGYRGARHEMFSFLDNDNGVVCGVYIDKCIETKGIPNSNVMNCEHSWPQSRGAVGIAKSDLHHLYPADSKVNSRRSNYPFCDVANERWSESGSVYGTDADGEKCFEPRDEHKGDVARSMLYFSLRYNKPLDSKQEEFFKTWVNLDPISQKEIVRNNNIEDLQNNRNPFVDIPEFVQLISDF